MENFIKTNSQNEFIETVCEIIKEEANKNIKEKGRFTFVLSGGRTPKDIFDELATNYKESIEWSKVHFFWLDERCVEATHEDSNYKLANDYLISKLSNVGSVHRIKCELKPVDAAEEYEKDLIEFFKSDDIKFDFLLLGMGEDGHVASLFPDSEELELVDKLVLATKKLYNGSQRITLGFNAINKSKFNLLMARDHKKIKILNSKNSKYPINLIKNIRGILI